MVFKCSFLTIFDVLQQAVLTRMCMVKQYPDVMKKATSLLLALFFGSSLLSYAVESDASELQGSQNEPFTAKIGNRAEIALDGKYDWLDKAQTRTFMKESGNLPGDELGCVVGNYGFATFEFDDIGYVKDDEKDDLDADEILKSLREGQKEANKHRVKAGMLPLKVDGWYKAPYYDEATNNLEWIVEISSAEGKSVNVNTRILGRHGIMTVMLVTAPEDLEAALAEYREWLKGFSFTSGQKYAEYRSGDKIAEYGLTALITGGSVFLLAKYWKVIVAALVAMFAGIKKFFSRGKKKDNQV